MWKLDDGVRMFVFVVRKRSGHSHLSDVTSCTGRTDCGFDKIATVGSFIISRSFESISHTSFIKTYIVSLIITSYSVYLSPHRLS